MSKERTLHPEAQAFQGVRPFHRFDLTSPSTPQIVQVARRRGTSPASTTIVRFVDRFL